MCGIRGLYKKEAEDEGLQREFLSKIDKTISNTEKTALDIDLEENELFEALKSSQDKKSPGADGLTKELYVHFWQIIKIPYLCCIQEIKLSKELTEMQKRGDKSHF